MLMSQNYYCNSWYPKKQNVRVEQVHQPQGYTIFIKIYVMPMSQNYDCNLCQKKLSDRMEQVIINRESSLGVCSGAVR
jgi:hypothetical protein